MASDDLYCVGDLDDAARLFRRLSRRALGEGARFDHLVICGGGMSTGGQSAQVAGARRVLRLDTRALRGVRVHRRSGSDLARGVLRVTAGAATTFGELADATRPFLPFCAPSESRHITLGGALASNAYSRASVSGGLLSEHVLGFSLATPMGRVLRCDRQHNARLFAAVPGSLGALGVVDEITLELRDGSPYRGIGSEVVARTRSVAELSCCLAAGLEDDDWELGRYALLHGDARGGEATVLRSRYVGAHDGFDGCGPMPGHRRSMAESAAHVVAHLWPGLCDAAARVTLRPGRRFVDRIEDFTFFQDAYVRSRRAVGERASLRALAAASGRAPSLPLVQQAFIVDHAALPIFLRAVGSTLSCFADVADRVALQDLVSIPPSETVMAPTRSREGAWVYTISFAVTERRRARIDTALRCLARVAQHSAAARVHLLKTVCCDDALLREMWRDELETLAELRAKHDPAALIDSALLSRLMPPAARRGIAQPRRQQVG